MQGGVQVNVVPQEMSAGLCLVDVYELLVLMIVFCVTSIIILAVIDMRVTPTQDHKVR